MTKQTREWVRKAEGDLAVARLAAAKAQHGHDVVCFLCQQGAEKYLKALLQELGQVITKTHDLEALLTHLSAAHPSLRRLKRGLIFLTDFAVDTRYPGKYASKR